MYNTIFYRHQLFRISGSSEDIKALENDLDILSARPGARSTLGVLEAVVKLSPEDKQQWFAYFEDKGITYTKIADNLAE